MKTLLLRSILLALPMVVRRAAKKHQSVRDKLQSGHYVVQLRMRDGRIEAASPERTGALA